MVTVLHTQNGVTDKRDTSLLSMVSDDADGIAEYVLSGLRNNGYTGWVTTNGTRQKRVYADADHETWADHD